MHRRASRAGRDLLVKYVFITRIADKIYVLYLRNGYSNNHVLHKVLASLKTLTFFTVYTRD